MLKSLFRDISRSYLLTALICFILGIALIVYPMASVTTLIQLIGWVAIINSVFSIGRYFTSRYVESKFSLYLGIFEAAVGLIMILFAMDLVALVPIVMGLVLLVNGGNNILKSFECKSAGDTRWYTLCIPAVALCILGIILMAYPFASSAVLIRLVGIGFLGSAFNEYMKSVHVRDLSGAMDGFTSFEDKVVDADVEHEEEL